MQDLDAPLPNRVDETSVQLQGLLARTGLLLTADFKVDTQTECVSTGTTQHNAICRLRSSAAHIAEQRQADRAARRAPRRSHQCKQKGPDGAIQYFSHERTLGDKGNGALCAGPLSGWTSLIELRLDGNCTPNEHILVCTQITLTPAGILGTMPHLLGARSDGSIAASEAPTSRNQAVLQQTTDCCDDRPYREGGVAVDAAQMAL